MEKNYQFRDRYCIVHKPHRRDASAEPLENETVIKNGWKIVIPSNADTVLAVAANDLVDYFATSMDVSVDLIRQDETYEDFCIRYEIDPSLEKGSYRLSVNESSVLLIGQNSRLAAQAGYFIEDLMNLREAPFLERTETVRTALFSPRMVHSGYGLDVYPDEYLINIAHSGIDAIITFIKNTDLNQERASELNELCLRAAKYGVDVYAYSYLANKLHPEDEGAEQFYEELYGRLLDLCPYFKGIIFVGESCEFPSKDSHTEGIRRKDNFDSNGKPLKNTKPYPGWWPCYDYTIWLELVSKIMRRRNPDIDIVFWSYNWCRVDASYRKALIDTLPKDITLQATFEMGGFVERDGIKNTTADYTLYYVGPGDYFKTEGQFAKENDLKFYSMTNTGGLTWDVGVVPYIPAPYRWMERYREMQDAHGRYGLCGIMESHHYGFTPSFISDLAKWAFWSPLCDLDRVISKIAARDFCKEHVEDVLKAYHLFSQGIYHLISVVVDQYGPFRIGPSYPLVLFENPELRVPESPSAHFGSRICYAVYGKNNYGATTLSLDPQPDEVGEGQAMKKFNYEIENFRECARLFTQGIELLYPLLDLIPESKRENARRIVGLCHFIRNTARTAVHAKEFFKRKTVLLSLSGKERNSIIDEMLTICHAEKENAIETIPLVEFDSRLGYEPSMEYMCDIDHIEWKLGLLEDVITNELPALKQ